MLKSRSAGIAGSVLVLALVGGYMTMQGNSGRAPSLHNSEHAEMAAYPPTMATQPGASAPESGKTIRINIAPNGEAQPGVFRFRKNEHADFRVTVPYDGMLAVHGYTNDMPIAANHELELSLDLAHTGRFPMHVHASDGQHIEVAVLEILPD